MPENEENQNTRQMQGEQAAKNTAEQRKKHQIVIISLLSGCNGYCKRYIY